MYWSHAIRKLSKPLLAMNSHADSKSQIGVAPSFTPKRFFGEGGSISKTRRSGRVAVYKEMKYTVNLNCAAYAICKCDLNPSFVNTRCQANTCGFSPQVPSHCNLVDYKPDCSWGESASSTYSSCEFAQTYTTAQWPGDAHYAVPPLKRPYISRHRPRDRGSNKTLGARVFVDIDDTLVCSGGAPGGVLEDCTKAGTSKKKVIPGAAMFVLALTLGPKDDHMPSLPIPLSARPKELKPLLGMDGLLSSISGSAKEIKAAFKSKSVKDRLKELHQRRTWRIDTDSAKYGSIFDVVDFSSVFLRHRGTNTKDFDNVANTKFLGFKGIYDAIENEQNHHKQKRLPHLHGSYFVGDNGQGDLAALQMMLAYNPSKDMQMQAGFIHDSLRMCDKACKEAWQQYGIHVFTGYAEAACIAEREGYISGASNRAVCNDLKKASAFGDGSRSAGFGESGSASFGESTNSKPKFKFHYPKISDCSGAPQSGDVPRM